MAEYENPLKENSISLHFLATYQQNKFELNLNGVQNLRQWALRLIAGDGH